MFNQLSQRISSDLSRKRYTYNFSQTSGQHMQTPSLQIGNHWKMCGAFVCSNQFFFSASVVTFVASAKCLLNFMENVGFVPALHIYIYMSRFYFTPQNWGHTVDISAIWRLDQLDQLMLSCFRNASEIPVINQKFPQTSGPLRWISFTITSSPGKNPLRIFLSYWRPLMESMKHEKGEVGTGNFYW